MVSEQHGDLRAIEIMDTRGLVWYADAISKRRILAEGLTITARPWAHNLVGAEGVLERVDEETGAIVPERVLVASVIYQD